MTLETLRFALAETSLGPVLVAASEKGLRAVLFGTNPKTLTSDLRRRFPKAELLPGDKAFGKTAARVAAVIEEPRAPLGLPLDLDLHGTAFQQRVWRALQAIPPGRTESYAGIAARIGAPKAARAVAGACAANALAVVVPCHRVVRGDGEVSGYRWGVGRKKKLLRREGTQS